MGGTVLLVEDRADLAAAYGAALRAAGHQVRAVATARAAAAALRAPEAEPACLVTDYQLPDGDGLALLRLAQEVAPRLPVIFITAHGSGTTAIEAMKAGAFDYLEKPLRGEDLARVVGEAVARRAGTDDALAVDSADQPGEMLVGRSRALLDVFKTIGRVAAMETPVLVVGDSGTGKELVCRAIHEHSPAAKAGFFAINCAAIPENLLESELFGHEKGAFTGATATRLGLFESAEGGTVFLDEIGDLPLPLQGKLLRVLQQRTVQRLGSHKEIAVRFRLVAATNRQLETMVRAERFRADLYHRLAGVKVELPTLAQRPEDIPLLAQYFLQRAAAEFGLQHAAIEPDALELLRAQPWPGNVRQLQNVVRTALLHARNLGINRATVEQALAASRELSAPPPAAAVPTSSPTAPAAPAELLAAWVEAELAARGTGPGNLHGDLTGALEERLLASLHGRLRGNRSRMAAALGLARLTLRKKLEALGLERDGAPDDE